MKLTLNADITHGWPKWENKDLLARYCSNNANTKMKVTFEPFKKRRAKSYDQLKMANALCKIIGFEQGQTKEEAKQDIKKKIGWFTYRESKITGKTEIKYDTCADKSIEEMKYFIEQQLVICDFLGIDLPPSDDMQNLYNYVDSL